MTRAELQAAMAKGRLCGALARAFKGAAIQLPDDLPDRIEAGLRKLLLDRLGLELRAGKVVMGSDRIAEQARIGSLLDADPLPATADELAHWVNDHPDIMSTRSQANAIEFLRDPPLAVPVKLGYQLLYQAAADTLPDRVADVIGVHPRRGAGRVGSAAVNSLRWALGSSPSWHLALVRSGAPVPRGLCKQPLPPEAQQVLDAAEPG